MEEGFVNVVTVYRPVRIADCPLHANGACQRCLPACTATALLHLWPRRLTILQRHDRLPAPTSCAGSTCVFCILRCHTDPFAESPGPALLSFHV